VSFRINSICATETSERGAAGHDTKRRLTRRRSRQAAAIVARRPSRLALLENLGSAVPRRTLCRLLLSVDSLAARTSVIGKSNVASVCLPPSAEDRFSCAHDGVTRQRLATSKQPHHEQC